MLEIIFLTVLTWITYIGVISCGYVSDDIEGLAQYSGKLKDYSYGSLIKWLLFKLCDKSPRRNHIFSIFLHNCNAILLLSFLSTFLPLKVSFLAAILFVVHPVCVQSVGWISGRGYPISLFFMLLNYNLIARFMPLSTVNPFQSFILGGIIILYALLYYLSVQAQFASMLTFLVSFYFGNYLLGLIGIALSVVTGLGIVREIVKLRAGTFKEQNLGDSTYLKPQKIIVAIKSLGYYTLLCLFPKRMGLYHTYEYYYSEKTEKEDKIFWLGFFILIMMAFGFWFGNTLIRFALLWYLAYIFIFLNFITVHQFVSERYCYIPLIGICLLTAYFLQNFLLLYAVIIGIALMRTWVHLPTYQDEVMFYQSNIFNHPKSEVAFTNLGVVYMRCQLAGAALDMWQIATQINPNYDVAWYNIASTLKQRNDLINARNMLKKAVDSPQCHFKAVWSKELEQLEKEIALGQEATKIYQALVEAERIPEKKEQAVVLKKQLEEINKLKEKFDKIREEKIVLAQQEESRLTIKMIEVKKIKEEALKPISMEELIKIRDINFSIIRENANKLLTINTQNAENKT